MTRLMYVGLIGLLLSAGVVAQQPATEKPKAEAPATVKASPAADKLGERADTDKVSLTGTAETLRKLETAIASAPDMNTDRVERVKNAIARGEYAVDNNRVAEKMIALERMLGAKI